MEKFIYAGSYAWREIKNPAKGPGLLGGVPIFAAAPIEDGYFLQVDYHGSKRFLTPQINMGTTQV
jgi:hypothetical protein